MKNKLNGLTIIFIALLCVSCEVPEGDFIDNQTVVFINYAPETVTGLKIYREKADGQFLESACLYAYSGAIATNNYHDFDIYDIPDFTDLYAQVQTEDGELFDGKFEFFSSLTGDYDACFIGLSMYFEIIKIKNYGFVVEYED